MRSITIVFKAAANPMTEVTQLLGEQAINIQDIDFKQFGDDAFLSVAVSDYDRALSLLIGKGFNTISDEIVLLRGEDRPGELARISRSLTELGVDIRSLTLMDVDAGVPVVAVSTTDNERVRKVFAGQVVG